MSAAVSGLSPQRRAVAREIAVTAAMLGYHNAPNVHYTMGARRWQGIDLDLKAYRGEYPRYADCSAFVTWCLWNGLDHYNIRDTVNGAAWKAGFTGTMLSHGKRVLHAENWLPGDAVIYGVKGTTGEHTAILVDCDRPVPLVVSHGSEGAPYLLPWNYRSDAIDIRRYV